NQEAGDYKLKRSNIKSIEYYEGLLLAEGDRLVLAREFAKAFEHYLAVKGRDPRWKGLQEHVDRLLFAEGSAALLFDNDRARGLRLLHELHERRPDYPGLADKLAAAYAGRIEDAFEKGAFRQARGVLHELETVAPKH